MIHSVRMPEQDRALLLEIVDLQKIILALATERTTAFSDEGQEISAHFQALPAYQANIDKITKWFTGKSQLFAWLNQYAQHPDIDAKRALKAAIEVDIELLLNPLQCRLLAYLPLSKLSTDGWEYGIGKFFYEFYDIWGGAGFQKYLFKPETAPDSNYTRSNFVQRFTAKNPNLYICPICDASSYRNETSSGTYTSLDHFFPRSLYPYLAIHPLNLLPMCPACNSGEAGQRDPQESLVSITDLILPYQGEENGLVGRTYVKIGFRPLADNAPKLDGNQPAAHALAFSLEVAADQEVELLATQIKNFEKRYGVQKRWNKDNNLTLIDEHVFRRIRQFLLSDIERGEPLHDPQFLMERLELLMAMIDKQSLGQDPFSYMMTWWLMYHIKRLEGQKEKIVELAKDSIDCTTYKMSEEIEPIFAELYCWAQEQQTMFVDLKEQAKRLRARIL
ncbi:hypothetical protein BH10CHL1_BH10CHL1_32520 [soil metagenome]